MNKHFVPVKNRTKYSVTSVMVYNKNCKQFFKEYDWMNELAFNMDIEDIKYFYPFSDETTMNVLLWKYGYNKRLHSQIVSEPQNLRTSIVTGLTMGSAIVYPKGVIKIECDQIPTTNS